MSRKVYRNYIIDEDDVNTGAYFDPYTYKTELTYDGIQLVKIDAYDESGQVVKRDYDFDDLGNLIQTLDYYDIHSEVYEWSGRRLDGINMYNDGILTQSIDYKYNSEGIRTYKKVGNDEYEYVLDGNLVLVEFINGNPIYYTYDANDQLLSMNYNGNEYFYVFDLLGNVIGLMNESGQLVVSYRYVAWGNQSVVGSNGVENTSPTFIGNINPCRYRGYRYDVETGYYYLQARYYDPEMGRFISIDDANYISDDISSGINLYAYALNNPVTYADGAGTSPTWNWGTFWKGTFMAATAVGAIAISIGTFGAATPLAMTIIAGVTLGAGVLTGINGVATLVEAGTDYNFVREGVFQGNANAYNWYSGITEAVAIAGTVVISAWQITGKIKGFTKHGLESALKHDGVGVSARAMQNATRKPLQIIAQSGGRLKYIGKNAVFVLNKTGKIITKYAKNSRGTRYLIGLWLGYEYLIENESY